jgi:hypothetical protein
MRRHDDLGLLGLDRRAELLDESVNGPRMKAVLDFLDDQPRRRIGMPETGQSRQDSLSSGRQEQAGNLELLLGHLQMHRALNLLGDGDLNVACIRQNESQCIEKNR